ncbi:MAG: uracil phosphoribosyltransferase [Planctomycetota bacterium]|jgi:uracil phosphoribosyltransferase
MAFQTATHPLVRHKIGLMRRNDITTATFRDLTREITYLLAYEAFSDLALGPRTVAGWAGEVEVEELTGKKVAVVPILRAGLGMLPGVLDLIPSARVNVVGLYRDERTLTPVEYYRKLSKDIDRRQACILDPMLATGNSLVATIEMLKEANCTSLRMLCLVAAPEGVQRIEESHPDVSIYAAALDDRLNDDGYILPGLGDAGDRIFGTR